MRALQIILGAFFALLALFAGGCSLVFLYMFLYEIIVSGYPAGDPVILIPLAGLSVAGFLGWLAWLMFRGRGGRPPDGGSDGLPGGPG